MPGFHPFGRPLFLGSELGISTFVPKPARASGAGGQIDVCDVAACPRVRPSPEGRVDESRVAGALMGVNGVTGDDLICTASRIREGDCEGSAVVCWLTLALPGVRGLPTIEERVFLILGCGGFKTSEITTGIASSSPSSSSSFAAQPTLSVSIALRIAVLAPRPVSAISRLCLCLTLVTRKIILDFP